MGTSPSRHEESSASSRVGGDGHAVPVAVAGAAASSATSGGTNQAQPNKAAASGATSGGTNQAPPKKAAASGPTSGGTNQAQPKKAPAPHMFQEIIAQEKTATAAQLQDLVNKGVYLAGKTKKYWVHEKTRGNCFKLFPRALSITWCEDTRFWNWHPLKETGDAEIEVVSLMNVCWLEIHGKLELSHLTPGVTYEVFFEVMLTKDAYGWSVPVNLRLKLPNGTVQDRKENLQDKPRGQWLDLKVGEIKAQQGHKGEMEISMFEYDGGHWKKGLLIKGIKIVPKE